MRFQAEPLLDALFQGVQINFPLKWAHNPLFTDKLAKFAELILPHDKNALSLKRNILPAGCHIPSPTVATALFRAFTRAFLNHLACCELSKGDCGLTPKSGLELKQQSNERRNKWEKGREQGCLELHHDNFKCQNRLAPRIFNEYFKNIQHLYSIIDFCYQRFAQKQAVTHSSSKD